MRKKIVKTPKGNEIAATEYVDDSRDPFEVLFGDLVKFCFIQVYVEDRPGHWLEVLSIYNYVSV